MPIFSIIKVDKNDVTIPCDILDVLGIQKGEYIIFKGSVSGKEITIKPLVPTSTETAELKVLLKNVPGTNANVDVILGKFGINILFGTGGIVDDNIYSSVKLLDLSECKHSLKDIKKEISAIPEVIDVFIEEV
ncbi:MAG: hypothetical protein ACXQS3_04010 [Candidatus Methanofastidiosia archaeon]